MRDRATALQVPAVARPSPPAGLSRRAVLVALGAGGLGLLTAARPSEVRASHDRRASPGGRRPQHVGSHDRVERHVRETASAFRRPIGRWQAGDLPHRLALPDGRALWLLNDSFLSGDPHGPIDDGSAFVRNLAMVEDAGRLAVVDRGDASFLADGESRYDRWWWFHGGVVDGDVARVVTTEMVRTGELGWAINFEPRSTWITTIRWRDVTVTDLRPAPNAGVHPVYGFAVASGGRWTYLFGNTHRYGHGTTETRLARVPRGQLLAEPMYWDGYRWQADPASAAVVHAGGTTDCRLHVARAGSGWVATAKVDEFLGRHVAVYRASRPQGPWREVLRCSPPTSTGDDRTCTYDAMCRPLGDGRLVLWWSNNGFDEALVRARPDVYRPRMAIVQLPG